MVLEKQIIIPEDTSTLSWEPLIGATCSDMPHKEVMS